MLILLSQDDGLDPFFVVELAANFIVVGLLTIYPLHLGGLGNVLLGLFIPIIKCLLHNIKLHASSYCKENVST